MNSMEINFSSLDELVNTNSYARKRYSASHDQLLVGLWGFFEKAASGLTRLYKGTPIADVLSNSWVFNVACSQFINALLFFI